MDKLQAEKIFSEEIGGRWPDLEISQVLMSDWIGLFVKFNPEDIAKAAKQYVLNHSQFKKPDLFKFKEIINSQSITNNNNNKVFVENWPQYFLQCDSKDCKFWNYGTFTRFHVFTQNPDYAMKLMEQQKTKQEQMYGGKWIIITCYDEQERRILINDRSQKNKTNTTQILKFNLKTPTPLPTPTPTPNLLT